MRLSARETALALGLLVLLVLGIWAWLWAGGRLEDRAGPEYVAVNGTRVVLATPAALIELDAEGRLQGGVALADLGIAGSLAGLQVLSDGSVLLGVFEARKVLRCELTRRRCEPIGPSEPTLISRAFRFHWDEATNRLYILDGDRHRLLVQEGAGAAARLLNLSTTLEYPNDLMVEDGGTVFVADTGHHRVAALEPHGALLRETEGTFPTRHPQARLGRTRPMAFTRDGAGRWWVVADTRRLDGADLVSFDTTGTPLRRVTLPEGAEPFGVAATATQILVTDPDRMRVDAVDPQRGTVRPFGDAAFRDWLRTVQTSREPFQAIASGAFWAIVLWPGLAVACGIYAVCERSRRRLGRRGPIARPVAKHLLGDVRWLAPDPELMAEMRRMGRILAASVCVAPIAMLLALWIGAPQLVWALFTGTGGFLLLALGFLVAFLVVGVLRSTLRAGRSLLGIRGSHVCLGDSDQRVYVVPPEAVLYTRSGLAYGPVTVPLRGVSRRRLPRLLYPREAFDRELQPLLARARQVSEIDLFAYQLLHRQPLAVAAAGVAILGPVVFVMLLALLPR